MSVYKSPPIGNNLSWIFWDFNKDFFKNPGRLECILRMGLKEDGLTPLDWHTYPFSNDHGKPIGYTMLVPLSESHLSVHSYSEFNAMTFNLYSCLGKDNGDKTYQRTLTEMNPKRTLIVKHIMPIDFKYTKNLEIKIHKN